MNEFETTNLVEESDEDDPDFCIRFSLRFSAFVKGFAETLSSDPLSPSLMLEDSSSPGELVRIYENFVATTEGLREENDRFDPAVDFILLSAASKCVTLLLST